MHNMLQRFGEELSLLKSAINRVHELSCLSKKSGEPADNAEKGEYLYHVLKCL